MEKHVKITDAKIESPASALAACGFGLDPAAGARVTFEGCVRNHDGGKGVTHLYYEAHPQAGQFLEKAVIDAIEAASGGAKLETVLVWHRVGRLAIGDIALLVVVDSAHRAEAFAVCARIVDEIKAQVPIWKNQYFIDGTEQWSNLP